MATHAHRTFDASRTTTAEQRHRTRAPIFWSPRAAGLPAKVQRHVRTSQLVESLLYPYVRTTWRVGTKTPPLPGNVHMAQLAVDALSGHTCVVDAVDVPLNEHDHGDVRWIPRRIHAHEVHIERVRHDLRTLVSRRLRIWSRIDLTLVGVTEAWKQIDLHEVTFSTGAHRLIAVDTLTGDYTSADD